MSFNATAFGGLPGGGDGGGDVSLYPSLLPHDSLQINIIVAAAVTWALSALLVAARLFTRWRIVHAVGTSDVCIFMSMVCVSGWKPVDRVLTPKPRSSPLA